MAAFVAVLLVFLPFALYLAWRRYGPASGEPSSGVVIAMLLGVGLMLGAAAWPGRCWHGPRRMPAAGGSEACS